MAKNERDFSITTRRDSRVAIRFPLQIAIRNGSASEVATAWTMVVTEQGARCECARGFAMDQEVEISNPANRKKSKGKIVWCGAAPDTGGKFEFAIEVPDASSLWHISFPRSDWKLTDSAAQPAAPVAPAAPPVPKMERTGFAAAEKALPPQAARPPLVSPNTVREPVPSGPVKPDGRFEKSIPTTPPPDRERESERLAMAALAAEVSSILEAAPQQRPANAQAGPPAPSNPPSAAPELKERLTQRLMEQIEPMIQTRMEEVLERTARSLETRLGTVLNEVCEARVADILERSQEITNLALSCIAEAADDKSKSVRQESEEAVRAAMQDLRSRIAKMITSLEQDLLRKCIPGGSPRPSR